PTSVSSAAVPVIVQLGPALTTLFSTPWTKAGPTIRPTVARDTKIVLIFILPPPFRGLGYPTSSLPKRRRKQDGSSHLSSARSSDGPMRERPGHQRAPALAGALSALFGSWLTARS